MRKCVVLILGTILGIFNCALSSEKVVTPGEENQSRKRPFSDIHQILSSQNNFEDQNNFEEIVSLIVNCIYKNNEREKTAFKRELIEKLNTISPLEFNDFEDFLDTQSCNCCKNTWEYLLERHNFFYQQIKNNIFPQISRENIKTIAFISKILIQKTKIYQEFQNFFHNYDYFSPENVVKFKQITKENENTPIKFSIITPYTIFNEKPIAFYLEERLESTRKTTDYSQESLILEMITHLKMLDHENFQESYAQMIQGIE